MLLPALQRQLLADGALCQSCPLARGGAPSRPVATEWWGREAPPVALVGEAPGRMEVLRSRPFCGPSGKILDLACAQAGIRRNSFAVLNACACGPIPAGDDRIKAAAAAACRPRLLNELRRLKPRVVMALGGVPLRTLIALGIKPSITVLRGALLRMAEDIPTATWRPHFTASFHPAHIMRGGKEDAPGEGEEPSSAADLLYYFFLYDIAKADRLAKGQAVLWADACDLFVYTGGLFRRVETDESGKAMLGAFAMRGEFVDAVARVRDEARQLGTVACDVESDGRDSLNCNLTAIGYATVLGGFSANWAAFMSTPQAFGLLQEIHADNATGHVRLLFHNRLWDTCALPRVGLPCAGPVDDTLLMHHGAFPGLPHKLDQVAQQFFLTSPWKSDFRASVKSQAELILYNCLAHGGFVKLADGNAMTIETIVRRRLPVRVQSYDGEKIEARLVVGWHRVHVPEQRWVRVRTAVGQGRGLVVTPDHEFYTQRGKVPAEALVPGKDYVAIDEVQFTDEQRKAVLGTLVGDTRLTVSPVFRRRLKEARGAALDGGHRSDTGLAEMKVAALAPHAVIAARLPQKEITINGVRTVGAPFTCWRTNNLYQLSQLLPLFYDEEGKRRLRVEVLDALGPLGLAWWFMDDGCRQNGSRGEPDGICFAACRYPREDVQRACVWFRERFSLSSCSVGKDRVIRIGGDSAARISMMIAEHVPPSMHHRFPRELVLPPFRALRPGSGAPVFVPVISVEPFVPLRETKSQRARADNRYCLTVEGNRNFFTTTGLVANCRDATATARLEAPLRKMLLTHKTEKVYEVDRQLAAVATRMRRVGYHVDLKEQRRQSDVQHARLDHMKAELTARFAAIAVEWRWALARRRAQKQRKKDPESYLARVQKRYNEIANRKQGPTDVGFFKTKAKEDLVALFEVLKIPIGKYTPTGMPVTDKSAMEDAAARHPLMRQLIHVREAQHLLATYIDGLPVREDGRVHPDWSVTKITGRWSAGKSQNIPRQVHGWPPLLDANGQPRRTSSGDLVLPIENPRAIITAPTAEEIVRLAERGGYVDPQVLARARAGKGRLLVGADFAQLELRIAAMLGKDAFLLDIFARGADPHGEFALHVFPAHFPKLVAEFKQLGISPKTDFDKKALDLIVEVDRLRFYIEEVLPVGARTVAGALARLKRIQAEWAKLRDLTKRLEYGGIYGGQAPTIYAALVKEFPQLTFQNVAEALKRVNDKMAGVVAWRSRMEEEARLRREIRTAGLGRMRLFPLGNFNASIVYNYPIQCGRVDQRVQTTSGWVRLDELTPSEHALVQKSGVTNNYVVHDTGVQPLVRVRTQGRWTVITGRHRFLAYVGADKIAWKRTEELVVGDHIVVSDDEAPQDDAPPVPGVDETLAEVIGVLFGNGHYASCGVHVSTGSGGYTEHLFALLRRAFPTLNVTGGHLPPRVRKGSARKTDGTYNTHIWRQEVNARLVQLGLVPAVRRAKRLPSWVETAPRNIRVAVLRGLFFDTDGGFAAGYCNFTTSVHTNAFVVLRLLLSVGVDARPQPIWAKSPAGGKRAYWRVRVMPWALPRFAEVIGFRHPERAALLRKDVNVVDKRRPLPRGLVAYIGEALRERTVTVRKSWTAITHARIARFRKGSGSVEQILRVLAETEQLGVDVADLRRAATQWRFEEIIAIEKQAAAPTRDIEIFGDDHSYNLEGVVTHNSFGSWLIALSIFRFVSMTHPELLQLDDLYRWGLLDRAWVAMARDKGWGRWEAPVELLINGHDSLDAEAGEDEAERACALLAASMDHVVEHEGAKMHFYGEARVGRRASEV